MSSETTRGPEDIGVAALDVDVTDPDEFREELIRLAEDGDAKDYETMEDRLTGLLSDVRKQIATECRVGGDAE